MCISRGVDYGIGWRNTSPDSGTVDGLAIAVVHVEKIPAFSGAALDEAKLRGEARWCVCVCVLCAGEGGGGAGEGGMPGRVRTGRQHVTLHVVLRRCRSARPDPPLRQPSSCPNKGAPSLARPSKCSSNPPSRPHLFLTRDHKPLVPLRILRHLDGVPLSAPWRAAVNAAPRGRSRGHPAGRPAAAWARRGRGVAGGGCWHSDWWGDDSLRGAHDALLCSLWE